MTPHYIFSFDENVFWLQGHPEEHFIMIYPPRGHPSIHYLSHFGLRIVGSAGADPSTHKAKAGKTPSTGCLCIPVLASKKVYFPLTWASLAGNFFTRPDDDVPCLANQVKPQNESSWPSEAGKLFQGTTQGPSASREDVRTCSYVISPLKEPNGGFFHLGWASCGIDTSWKPKLAGKQTICFIFQVLRLPRPHFSVSASASMKAAPHWIKSINKASATIWGNRRGQSEAIRKLL